jgi:hypothetical protein
MLIDLNKEVKTLEEVEAVYNEYGIIPKNTPEELVNQFKDKREEIKEKIKDEIILIIDKIKNIPINKEIKIEQENLFPILYEITKLSKLGLEEFKEAFKEIDLDKSFLNRIENLIYNEEDYTKFKELKMEQETIK